MPEAMARYSRALGTHASDEMIEMTALNDDA